MDGWDKGKYLIGSKYLAPVLSYHWNRGLVLFSPYVCTGVWGRRGRCRGDGGWKKECAWERSEREYIRRGEVIRRRNVLR